MSESAVRGHVREAREGTVVHLLTPAGLVELDHANVGRLGEVAHGRVDEREVAVLADPENREARRLASQQARVARALGREVLRLAVEAVERGDPHVREEPVHQEAPEGRRVLGADSDVLVEVEGRELRPVDPGRLPQLGEELVLRRRRGEDDRGSPVAPDQPADLSRDDARRGRAHRGPVRVHLDPHPSHAEGARARVAADRSAAQLVARPTSGTAAARPPAPRSRGASASPTRRRPSARSSPAAGARASAPPGSRRSRSAPAATERGRPASGARPSGARDARARRASRNPPPAARRTRRRRWPRPRRRRSRRCRPPRRAHARPRRSRSRRGSRARPRRRCRAGGRGGSRAPRRSTRAWTRGRRRAARGRRRRGCPRRRARRRCAAVRAASSTAVRRAAASGLWKNERVSTQGTASPASARRARVSTRPAPTSSGRSQSASSFSRKRSSTPS